MTVTRGCGTREDGGIYACCTTSPLGRPVWDFVIDPPIPYNGEWFRGIHFAPKYMTEGWPDDQVLLIDCVSKGDYPSVASFVEEVRRYGLSRRMSANFKWSSLLGKQAWLGLIHARAITRWEWDDGDRYLHLNDIPIPCKFPQSEKHHRFDCTYMSWLMSPMFHRHNGDIHPEIEMPWGNFYPSEIFKDWKTSPPNFADAAAGWHDNEWGYFARFPIQLFQVVKGLPKDCKFHDSGQILEKVNE